MKATRIYRKAARAIEAFDGGNGDLEDDITDLVADLQHYAKSKGLDWASIIRKADYHVAAEERGEC